MKSTLSYIAAIVLIVVLSYGGFKFERWYRYKFGYQDKIQEEIQKQIVPLEKRVVDLEQRLKQLEEKR